VKLTKNNLAKGLALATAILWVLCSSFVAVFPDFSHTVTQWWMHGMVVSKFNLDWSNFIWGGLSLVASAWLAGWVLGWSLEIVGKNANN
jgi:hypothetical protein